MENTTTNNLIFNCRKEHDHRLGLGLSSGHALFVS